MKQYYNSLYGQHEYGMKFVCTDVHRADNFYYVDVRTIEGEELTLTIIPGLSPYAFAPEYWFSVRFFEGQTINNNPYHHITALHIYYSREDLMSKENEIFFGNSEDERIFLDTEKNTIKYFTKSKKLKGVKPSGYNKHRSHN